MDTTKIEQGILAVLVFLVNLLASYQIGTMAWNLTSLNTAFTLLWIPRLAIVIACGVAIVVIPWLILRSENINLGNVFAGLVLLFMLPALTFLVGNFLWTLSDMLSGFAKIAIQFGLLIVIIVFNYVWPTLIMLQDESVIQ